MLMMISYLTCNCKLDSESSRNMIKFPTVAREYDKYDISDAAEIAIAIAALSEYGIIKKHESYHRLSKVKAPKNSCFEVH